MKMEIRNGKFYDGGKEVAPEFGNIKQIQLLKRTIRELEEAETDDGGIICTHNEETIVKHDINFSCKCGQKVWYEYEGEEYDKVVLDDYTPTCSKCKTKYELSFDDDDDEIIAREKK